ncbi:MAG: response regulator [Candidatus Methylomirabilales bacterium]
MGRRARILVADDDPRMARAMERAIRSWGYEVVGVVSSAAEAVEQARRHPLDLAVLDAGMPGGHGLAAARHLSQRLGIPVILTSGRGASPALPDGLDVEVPCLRKPVELLELKAALLWALESETGRMDPVAAYAARAS